MLLICLLLTACNNVIDNNSSSVPEEESLLSDVSEESSGGNGNVNNRINLFERNIQIELPENITYSREVRKDYREYFEEYFALKASEYVHCYVWTESGELKFGIGEIASISDYNSIISTMKAATLGELRAILSTGYSFDKRQMMNAIPLDDSLNGYTDELEYMLGIGKDNLEFFATFGSFTFDIPIWGKDATEMYSLLEETRKTVDTADNDDMSSYKGDEPMLGISFAYSGTIDFGGISDMGCYSITPDGYITYVKSLYSSSMLRYVADSTLYRSISDRVLSILNDRGIKLPAVKEDESFCTVKAGLYSNKAIVIGKQSEAIYNFANELSKQAKQPSEDFKPNEDYEKAIYIEFFDGKLDLTGEFVVYPDEYCVPLTPLNVSNRPHGVLPNGSYNRFLEFIAGDDSKFECRVSFGRTSDSYTVINGKTAREIFEILDKAQSLSRDATQKERLDHSGLHDAAVDGKEESEILHITFTAFPESYLYKSYLYPWYSVWPDGFMQWNYSSLVSFMPKPIMLPDGSYEALCEIIKNAGGETFEKDIDLADGVAEFLNLAKEKGINIDENATVYNLTPKEVADNTNYRIFKEMTDFGSYVTVDGEIYVLCSSFGGWGFHTASPCDFDNNGVIDLIVRSSWGSGMHRDEISVFNMTTKRFDVILSSIQSDVVPNGYYGCPLTFERVLDENATEHFRIIAFKPTTDSFVSSHDSVIVGKIVSKGGKPVFVKSND